MKSKEVDDERESLFNVTAGHAKLYFWDGTRTNQIGYVVTGPQDCGDGTYGTAEWIRELTFVETANEYSPALDWLANNTNHAIDDASGTTGCGHISRNVPVYKLVRDLNGVWTDASDSDYDGSKSYYCLVAAGTPGTPKYKASAIWISKTDWPPTLHELKDACGRDIPKSKKCRGGSNCPPCNRVV